MYQSTFPCNLEITNSSEMFRIPTPIMLPPRMKGVFTEADGDVKIQFPYFLPSIYPLEVKGASFSILVIPQTHGGFVARISTSRFNATGQGKTEKQALQDIKSAIELLLEEESKPSGDVVWPEDYR